jgi:hypothetical protein
LDIHESLLRQRQKVGCLTGAGFYASFKHVVRFECDIDNRGVEYSTKKSFPEERWRQELQAPLKTLIGTIKDAKRVLTQQNTRVIIKVHRMFETHMTFDVIILFFQCASAKIFPLYN